MRIVERSRRTFERRRRSLAPATRHDPPSPVSSQTRDHVLRPSPSRVPRVLPAARACAVSALGSGSLRFVALRRRHSIGPRIRRTVRVRRGSAHGVLSPPRRLPGSIKLAAASARTSRLPPHHRAVRASSPFRAFPSRGSRTPRRGRWLPCRSSRPIPLVRRALPCHPRFHQPGRRSGVGTSPVPPRARGSLSARLATRLPVTLDLARRAHHVPAVPSTSKRSSPPRVRSRRSRRSPRRACGRCSPGRSRPSRALLPPRPRALVL